MHRILKVGGQLLVYVWAYEQEEKKFQTQDVFVPWHLQDKYEEKKQSSSAQKPNEENQISNTPSNGDQMGSAPEEVKKESVAES